MLSAVSVTSSVIVPERLQCVCVPTVTADVPVGQLPAEEYSTPPRPTLTVGWGSGSGSGAGAGVGLPVPVFGPVVPGDASSVLSSPHATSATAATAASSEFFKICEFVIIFPVRTFPSPDCFVCKQTGRLFTEPAPEGRCLMEECYSFFAVALRFFVTCHIDFFYNYRRKIFSKITE